MGAGDYGAGAGIAGADPVYIAPAVAPVLRPRAALYDPTIKQFVLTDANGNAIDVHPVDQMVAIRLTTEQGASGSSPTLGQRIRARFALAAPTRHLQIAFSEVSNTLSDLVAAGDVILVSVELSRNVNGAQVVIPTYVNLRHPDTNPQFPLQNATSATQVSV